MSISPPPLPLSSTSTSTSASSSSSLSSSSSSPRIVALTERQESRLVLYLDEQLLRLSQAFESRTSPTSSHPTLESYLTAVKHLFTSFVLTIPPIEPSHSLRVAYALTITGLLPTSIKAYPIHSTSLDTLWSTLKTFDQAWLTILNGNLPYPHHSNAIDLVEEEEEEEGRARRLRARARPRTKWIERARLSSLIGEIKRVTAMQLGDPSYEFERGKAYDPRGQVVKPRLWDSQERKALKEVGLEHLDSDYTQETIDRHQVDQDTKMQDLSRQNDEHDDNDDEDEDEDDFEEVDVLSAGEASQTREKEDEKPLEIHFKPDPMRLEASVNDIKPTKASLGFDPDVEYPVEDADEEDLDQNRNLASLFERTLKALHEMAQEG